jgi:hypothetical protein
MKSEAEIVLVASLLRMRGKQGAPALIAAANALEWVIGTEPSNSSRILYDIIEELKRSFDKFNDTNAKQ